MLTGRGRKVRLQTVKTLGRPRDEYSWGILTPMRRLKRAQTPSYRDSPEGDQALLYE